ncbi:hypothetical protein DSO57_1010001 [Entomophthora muscae]|uniref:Uncharacterized protein n=1 Tax=Entomophthora muscae TaxID=34485 RepID=A0ACC2RLQ4_9FUNG|nr:hypothetical protein DSO57_1010001 [Entomophthora muscae]
MTHPFFSLLLSNYLQSPKLEVLLSKKISVLLCFQLLSYSQPIPTTLEHHIFWCSLQGYLPLPVAPLPETSSPGTKPVTLKPWTAHAVPPPTTRNVMLAHHALPAQLQHTEARVSPTTLIESQPPPKSPTLRRLRNLLPQPLTFPHKPNLDLARLPASGLSVPQAVKPTRRRPASVCPQSPSSASDKDPVEDFFEVDEEPPANLPRTPSRSSTSSGDHCHPTSLSENPAPPLQRRRTLEQTSSRAPFVSHIESLPVPTAPPSYQSVPSAPPLPMHQVAHPGPSDDSTISDMEHVHRFLSENGDVLVTVGSIMPGIVCPSKKAQKVRKPVSKLTKLTDLNQKVNQKWVTAAPVCQLKPAPPCKLTLIN